MHTDSVNLILSLRTKCLEYNTFHATLENSIFVLNVFSIDYSTHLNL